MNDIRALALQSGAFRAEWMDVSDIPFDPVFRSYCEMNSCGCYGRNWMCPPAVGDTDTLIKEAMGYHRALIYQTVGELEDPYDVEGMHDAKERHRAVTAQLEAELQSSDAKHLHLGAGGCSVCEKCAYLSNEPCRFPSLAVPSMEAYCVNVSLLAPKVGMKYINGQNTVTYFGAVLFPKD